MGVLVSGGLWLPLCWALGMLVAGRWPPARYLVGVGLCGKLSKRVINGWGIE